MAPTVNEQELTNGEKGKVLLFLIITAVFLMVEIGFMDVSLLQAPFFIQAVYDKVTLPSWLHFITRFKGIFALFMYLLSCVPALLIMAGTGLVLSKIADKK